MKPFGVVPQQYFHDLVLRPLIPLNSPDKRKKPHKRYLDKDAYQPVKGSVTKHLNRREIDLEKEMETEGAVQENRTFILNNGQKGEKPKR